jgi:hypothetical protein
VSGFSRAHGMPTRLRGETLTGTYVFTNPLHLPWDKPGRHSTTVICFDVGPPSPGPAALQVAPYCLRKTTVLVLAIGW